MIGVGGSFDECNEWWTLVQCSLFLALIAQLDLSQSIFEFRVCNLLYYECVYVDVFCSISRISTFVLLEPKQLSFVPICTNIYVPINFCMYTEVHLNTFWRSWSCFLINKRCKCSLSDKYNSVYSCIFSVVTLWRPLGAYHFFLEPYLIIYISYLVAT